MPAGADKADGAAVHSGGLPTVVRLCLFYGAIYLSSGVSLPYIGTYLRSRGMSGGEIGLILALPLLLRPFTGASLAVWADGFTLRRTPMILLLIGAGLGYAGLLVTANLWWLALAWFVGQTLLSTVSPLIDVISLRRARVEGFNYGVPRGTGSSTFIFANLAMGAILTFAAPTVIASIRMRMNFLPCNIAPRNDYISLVAGRQHAMKPDPIFETIDDIAARLAP